MRLENKLAQILISKRLTLSIAESCTGGLVSHLLTNVPGSSQFLFLSIVAYDNRAKSALLKVPPRLIKQHGAVSQEAAQQMAIGAQSLLKTSLSLAITGIAGPTGGSLTKPVGTVFISACFNKRIVNQVFTFKGTRQQVKNQSAKAALKILIHLVSE